MKRMRSIRRLDSLDKLERIPKDVMESTVCKFLVWTEINAVARTSKGLNINLHRVVALGMARKEESENNNLKWCSACEGRSRRNIDRATSHAIGYSVCKSCARWPFYVARRKAVLEAALDARDLDFRQDSKMCRKFVHFGRLSLRRVVETMEEMDWFYAFTNYGQRERWPHCLNMDDEWWLPEEDNDDDDDDDEQTNDNTHMGLRDSVRAGHWVNDKPLNQEEEVDSEESSVSEGERDSGDSDTDDDTAHACSEQSKTDIISTIVGAVSSDVVDDFDHWVRTSVPGYPPPYVVRRMRKCWPINPA